MQKFLFYNKFLINVEEYNKLVIKQEFEYLVGQLLRLRLTKVYLTLLT